MLTNTKFLVQLRAPSDSYEDCVSFFNETWICFGAPYHAVDRFFDASEVLSVEHDAPVYAQGCQQQAPWHLQAISRRETHGEPPVYQYDEPQPATTVYVLDTWVDTAHPEFEGRARVGTEFATGTRNAHGTHVAALIAGKQAGVNKQARIVAVPVLGDDGYGSWSTILRGLAWVAERRPSIINLSIGGGRSDMVNRVVDQMVRRGWKIVVAAGNEAADACYTSPASAALAITVGATTQQQRLADFSNFGACVDILAPGDAILSAVPRNRYGYMSGTSMASPIVAGVWSLYPDREPRELLRLTVNNQVPMLPPGTPNRQLYNRPTYACGLLDPFAAFLLQT